MRAVLADLGPRTQPATKQYTIHHMHYALYDCALHPLPLTTPPPIPSAKTQNCPLPSFDLPLGGCCPFSFWVCQGPLDPPGGHMAKAFQRAHQRGPWNQLDCGPRPCTAATSCAPGIRPTEPISRRRHYTTSLAYATTTAADPNSDLSVICRFPQSFTRSFTRALSILPPHHLARPIRAPVATT
jgi:hypothetical protein